MSNDTPELITGRELEGHTSAVLSCAVARDGRVAVTASLDKTAVVWDIRTGSASRTLCGHTDRVFDCKISADATRIVTSSYDGTVRLWDQVNGQCVSILRSAYTALSRAYGCGISDDGLLVFATFGAHRRRKAEFVVYNWSVGNDVVRSSSHTFYHAIRQISVAPSVNLLAFTTCDESDGSRSAHIVDLRHCIEHRSIPLTKVSGGFNAGVSIAVDSRTVAVADNKHLRLLQPHDPQQDILLRYYSPSKCHTPCVINEKGTRVIASNSDNSFSVWDVTTRTIVAVLDGPGTPQYSCGMSLDGRTVLIGRHFGAVRVHDVSTLTESARVVTDVNFARDWFKSRGILTLSLEQSMLDLNSVFAQLNFEKFDDALLTAAIDSVLNESDVFMTELQFVEIFRVLRRHAIEIEDINKAREQWSVMFNRVAGTGEDATLRISLSAWRLIKGIHDERSEANTTMSKDTAIKLLRLCAKESASAVTREEFLEAAQRADKRWGMGLDEIEMTLSRAAAEHKGEEVQCVIDLAVIEKGQRVVRLPCMHCFHADCMLPYLEREQTPLCPIDKSPVAKEYVPLLPVWIWGMP